MKDEFEITVINTETGEPETGKINEKNCWKTLKGAFICGSDLTPKKPGKRTKKKPVKMQLKLISVENDGA